MLVQEELTAQIIAAAVCVHGVLGPGLLESAYEECLAHELVGRGLQVRRQVSVPILYNGQRLECGFRMDMLVEGKVIIELKAVDRLKSIHEAQLVTYLRLAGKPVGLVINFNELRLKDGLIRRVL